MHDTLGAIWLGVTKNAALQTTLGIVKQRSAVGAKWCAAMVMTAVHANHDFNGFEFSHAPDEARVPGEFNELIGH